MLTLSRLEDCLARFPEQRVLVIGDLILDEYLWGKVERISPEAPVQIVDIQREFLTLGGAGNVLANILSLGGRAQLCSVIGCDQNAQVLIGQLHQRGLSTEGLFKDSHRPTTKKTRVLAAGQQILRIDREIRQPIEAGYEEEIFHYFIENLSGYQAIILSDYQKGVLTDSLLARIIAAARQEGKPVFIDPKGSSYCKYRRANYLTPNLKEAGLATNMTLGSEEQISQAGQKLLEDLALDGLIITRGQDGISVFTPHQLPVSLPTKAKEVYDVSGAGDTVLASLTLGYCSGLSINEAAWLANLAAGVVVGKVGTATVNPSEIIGYCHDHLWGEQKNKNCQDLLDLITRHRLAGQKIVFTNGCFDLFHVGHIKLLQEAKKFGDILVVAINDDASVTRLKGLPRPCMTQEERVQLLGALDCVDYLTVFSDDNPMRLLEMIKPDVLAKGTDYNKEEVVGWSIVDSYGGSIKLINLAQNISTSHLIDRILKKSQTKGKE